MSKNKKNACCSGHSMSPHKFLTKRIFYVASVKKTKICPVNSHMFIYKFVFLYGTQKLFFLFENLYVNIICLDVHAKFSFQFF
jgi:hypothetical protein